MSNCFDYRNQETLTVDAQGLRCPEPVMMLHNAIRDAKSGDIIKIVATDPSTERDIARFCQFLDHPLLGFEREDEEFLFWVRKK